MRVKVKKLHPDAILPTYATDGSSGFDLVAIETVGIPAGKTGLIRTGLSFEIPKGYELQVRPRSGVSSKTKLRVANSPGTVDSDFRGEVCVIIDNTETECNDSFGNGCGCHSEGPRWIEKGSRIAQGVICPIVKAEFQVVESLQETARGAGGFGSTDRTDLEKIRTFLTENNMKYEEGSNDGVTPFIFLHFDDKGKADKESE
jgi:dUTP pyrophosphatase